MEFENGNISEARSIYIRCYSKRSPWFRFRGMGATREQCAKKKEGSWTARAEQRQMEVEEAKLEAQWPKDEVLDTRREDARLHERYDELLAIIHLGCTPGSSI